MSKAMRPMQRFSSETPSIQHLIDRIDMGTLVLPDLQRPFVWKRSRVRDFFDSLYQGFPAGYFLFWDTQKHVGSHSIGVDTTERANQRMIVDGQQRLTGLYAVMKGKTIINEDNEEQLIRIAFNPLTEEFTVANASSDNNPAFISNISDLWSPEKGIYDFITEYIEELGAKQDISPDQDSAIKSNIQHLQNINNYHFSVLVLSADLEVDIVAEIFQRINSRGISLNSADFILTLMSVYWTDGRFALEDFSRKAKTPSTDRTGSPYNEFLAPSPDQLLRVAVGLGLKRGSLQNAYQELRGRDPKDRVFKEEQREKRFNDLKQAHDKVLNLSNWHEYITCVKAAGFRSKSMLTSANNFLYGYLIFLIGKHEFDVDNRTLQRVISRWFFMSALTGRYSGSPETVLEADLRRLREITQTAAGFVGHLDNVISKQLVDDYWRVSLTEQLRSSSAYSPCLFGYHAALNLLGATALFSNVRISDIQDAAVTGRKTLVDRHHLFPRAYLLKQGHKGAYQLNQIANTAFVDPANGRIPSDGSPQEYFPDLFQSLTDQEKSNASYWHALPENWPAMKYWDFISKRRKLMANVIRDGFKVLTDDIQSHTGKRTGPSVSDLLRDMESLKVEFKATARVPLKSDVPERVITEGVIKTVAAFMNTEGGTLGIGISDDGDILGIQADLDHKRQDPDAYENWLSAVLIASTRQAAVAQHVRIQFETVADQVVCLVYVSRSSTPVYVRTENRREVLYVRIGNSTRIMDGPDLVEYIKQRF